MRHAEVIEALSTYRREFPRAAVETAANRWDDFADEMVRALEYTAENMGEVAAESTAMLHTYAMHLCAEKRERRAFLPMIRILSYEGHDELTEVLGDTLTSAAGRILASTYGGDPEPIQQLIENRRANEYARIEGLQALLVLVLSGMLPRQTLVSYLQELYEGRLPLEPCYLWHQVASVAADIGAAELWPVVERSYGVLAQEPPWPSKHVTERIHAGPENAMELARRSPHHGLMRSAVEEMEWWAAFDTDPEQTAKRRLQDVTDALAEAVRDTGTEAREPVRRPGRKPGRNEPCPCGSGKKYKHCCGR
jgi:hypothetical protein